MPRSLLILFLGAVLVTCGGIAHCPTGSGPERVTVDASAYADLGILKICVGGEQTVEAENCVEDGTSVETTLEGEYPKTYPYEIYQISNGATDTLLRSGSVKLSCDQSHFTVSFEG